MHYSRVPSFYWKDRLLKLVAGGLNAVQTYVPWNFHEATPGKFNFTGDRDLVTFIKTAQEVGLDVILRPGPYICAEWDMGGLPSWLLRHKGIALRTSDSVYLMYVDRWMSVLLPKIKPFLHENGGPIITVQVENEYGSYFACDGNYLTHLHGIFRQHLGETVVLFTTDGNSEGFLKCGANTKLFYATVDFGVTSDPAKSFAAQRAVEPHGPLVNSEFYTGWLDYWGKAHSRVDSKQVAESLDAILKLNASVNMYMFIGGTNFGFWNGADAPGAYLPVPTSYDYDAPLTEAGDPWEKFTMIRDVIRRYHIIPSVIPPPTPKSAYGTKIIPDGRLEVWFALGLFKNGSYGPKPVSMEDLGESFGFVIYFHYLPVGPAQKGDLVITECHDRATVYVYDNKFDNTSGFLFKGSGMRSGATNGTVSIPNLEISKGNVENPIVLAILVENMGRINYGTYINDSKGILGDVTFDGKTLEVWQSFALPMSDIEGKVPFRPLDYNSGNIQTYAVFYQFHFNIEGKANDTYLNVDNWTKGVAFVNGVNIGRYWPKKGPQKTLYVPANILKSNTQNSVILFEIDQAPCDDKDNSNCFISFTATPDIG